MGKLFRFSVVIGESFFTKKNLIFKQLDTALLDVNVVRALAGLLQIRARK